MAFDVEGAKQAGYSDAEIASHLAGTTNFDAEGARKAGYSDQEIIGQLAGAPAPAAKGDHGYAPAPPETPAPSPWEITTAREGSPEELPPTLTLPSLGIPAATFPGPGIDEVPIEMSRYTGKNPTWALSDPRESLAPTTIEPGRLAGAAAEGWRATPSILTPEGQDVINEMGPLGRQIINPALKILNIPVAAANGLLYGGAELANQLTGDPRAGRDALMLAQVAPMAHIGTGVPPVEAPAAAPTAPPRPRFISEVTAPDVSQLDPRNAIQTLIEHDTRENPPPAPDRGAPNQGADTRAAPLMEGFNQSEPAAPDATSAPTAEPPGPKSVGAGASREGTPATELGLTPAEEAAYRSTAEGNKLLEPQEPGVRDDKQYLTGERINEAQASQDVEVARELQSLRQQTPPLDAKMTADENHNNNITANAIENAIPGQVQIRAAKDARQAAMETNEPKTFANATDADVRPVVKEIQDILNDPKNLENSQLRQYVRPLVARLQNPDGAPKITNPLQLWGWRQDVQHLTSGAAQAADPNLSRVSGLLGRVLDTTDNQLETAAPGYKANLRDSYRTRSNEIDAMEALNAERFKLFDSQNKPNYNAVQSLMRRVVDARQANDPYDPYTHVPQETLDSLWNIRDSMRRRAAVDRLGAPRGSPTSQNLGDALRGAGKTAIKNAAPAIGAGLGTVLFPGMPIVGSTLGLMAGGTVNHLLSEAGMRQRMTRGLELTNPNTLMHPLP